MLALVIAEGVVLLLLGLLVAGLLRSHAEILRALHDLGASVEPGGRRDRREQRAVRREAATGDGVDAPAYDIVGTDVFGAAAAVGVVNARQDTLLAFLSTGCTTCQPFWSAFRAGVGQPDGARVVVVVQEEESEARLRELAGTDVEVIASNPAWEAYDVPGSPHFVYVDGPSGRVTGEGTGPDWPSVRALLGQATADRAARGETRGPADVEWRDNPTRIDAELTRAGIGADHPSLTAPPDAEAG